MIDWTKPIETVDGLRATQLHEAVDGGWHCIYVFPDPESCGSKHDVFLVDDCGNRCDDRAINSTRQEPFIRNVKVKREGWVLMRPWSSWSGEPINIVGLLAMHHVYPSEEEAKYATRYFEVEPGTKPVHLTWEE